MQATTAEEAVASLEAGELSVAAKHDLSTLYFADSVVIYDSGAPSGVGSAFKLASLLNAGSSVAEVAVLKGGFSALAKTCPHLVAMQHSHGSARAGSVNLTPKGWQNAGVANVVLDLDGGNFSIFVGGRREAADLIFLQKHRVTHVLNCTKELPCHHREHVKCLRLGLLDDPSENLGSRLNECMAFIDEARHAAAIRAADGGGAALVHCYMGRSRSVTVAAAYAVHALGLSAKESLQAIRNRRPEASPNYGFKEQLVDWAQQRSGVLKTCVARQQAVRLSVTPRRLSEVLVLIKFP